MLNLAVPVVAAEIGWITMGIVDTIMVGPLGPDAIGAVGLGSVLFISIAIFGVGVLLGLDPLIAQAFGAGRLRECHRWLVNGVLLSAAMSVPMTGLALLEVLSLEWIGLHPEVLKLTGPYLRIVSLSLFPLLLYATFRRYLQAMNIVIPLMFALISANLINAFSNWVLIFGHLGVPALGTRGAAWATCISRTYMAIILLLAIVIYDKRRGTGLFPIPMALRVTELRRLVRIGLPAALQVTLELGAFAVASALIGRLNPSSLAAHQIALHWAGFTFMVPLGISSAGAVRVGQAMGREDPSGAGNSGWAALLIGVLFMSVAAFVFVLFPGPLLRLFTSEASVLATGASLLLLAAVFQMFDGVQVVATGALRGLGDTRTPMLINLAGHWVLGLPLGYGLSFRWGVIGIWIGLSTGLIVVGIILLGVWWRRSRSLYAAPDSSGASVP